MKVQDVAITSMIGAPIGWLLFCLWVGVKATEQQQYFAILLCGLMVLIGLICIAGGLYDDVKNHTPNVWRETLKNHMKLALFIAIGSFILSKIAYNTAVIMSSDDILIAGGLMAVFGLCFTLMANYRRRTGQW